MGEEIAKLLGTVLGHEALTYVVILGLAVYVMYSQWEL